MKKDERYNYNDYGVYNYLDKIEASYNDYLELRKIQEEQENLRKYEEDYDG